MRHILTIARYEILMQIKSLHFKAALLLVAICNFNLYREAMMRSSFDLSTSISFCMFSVLACGFAGLYAVGRLRSTGVHPVLMVRPFHTFSLLMGQLLGAFIPFLFCGILMFAAGPVAHWRLDVTFNSAGAAAFLFLCLAPLMWTLICAAIWVRTCVKNIIAAVIVLGMLIFGMGMLANSAFLRVVTFAEEGRQVSFSFVPIVSLLNEQFMGERIQTFLMSPHIKLEWRMAYQVAMHVGCSMIFLLLACYHLRRTEPHRKVLGRYGMKWTDMPTFVRVACDMRLDPYISRRTHIILTAISLFLLFEIASPIASKYLLKSRQTAKIPQKSVLKQRDLSEDDLPESVVLPAVIHKAVETVDPQKAICDLTISITGSTKDKSLFFHNPYSSIYLIQKITLDGAALSFIERSYILIDGKAIAPFADGKPHQFKVEAVLNKGNTSGMGTWTYGVPFFANAKNAQGFFCTSDQRWPRNLSITVASDQHLENCNLLPRIVDSGKNLKTYVFEYPLQRALRWNNIAFSNMGEIKAFDLSVPGVPIHVLCASESEKLTREAFQMLQPSLQEFCQIQRIHPERPIIISTRWGSDSGILEQMSGMLTRYRKTGVLRRGENEQLQSQLDQLETGILKRMHMFYYQQIIGWELSEFWDLLQFMSSDMNGNLQRGMNAHIVTGRPFLPEEYQPIQAHVANPLTANGIQSLARTELMRKFPSQPPVFQMLYFMLGHEKWWKMIDRLKVTCRDRKIMPEDLAGAAKSVSGESYDWFVDYWLVNGKGYPMYQIESATAHAIQNPETDKTEYTVQAKIKSIGTGKMLLPVRVRTVTGPVDDKIWIDAGETVTWTTTTKNLPQVVRVDPEGWMMMMPYVDPKTNTREETPTMTVKMQ